MEFEAKTIEEMHEMSLTDLRAYVIIGHRLVNLNCCHNRQKLTIRKRRNKYEL